MPAIRFAVRTAALSHRPANQVLFSPDDQHEVEVRGKSLIILRERDAHAIAAEGIEESTGRAL